MKRKHFVLGFVFNSNLNSVLLVEKKRPDWQAGYFNGIGGKIEDDETPLQAMQREGREETGHGGLGFEHVLTFVCPGGTVFVFKGNSGVKDIPFKQMEDEELRVYSLVNLVKIKIMANPRWMIPVCLSNLQFPIILQQNTLGVE